MTSELLDNRRVPSTPPANKHRLEGTRPMRSTYAQSKVFHHSMNTGGDHGWNYLPRRLDRHCHVHSFIARPALKQAERFFIFHPGQLWARPS
jgi:hypothetical protein